jgi:hypothetical protein
MSAVKTELMEKGARVTHLISSSLSFGLWSRALLSCLSLGTNPTGIFAVEWEGLPFSCVVSSSLLPCVVLWILPSGKFLPRLAAACVATSAAAAAATASAEFLSAAAAAYRPPPQCWEKENVSCGSPHFLHPTLTPSSLPHFPPLCFTHPSPSPPLSSATDSAQKQQKKCTNQHQRKEQEKATPEWHQATLE